MLALHGVGRRFAGGVVALADVNISVQANDFVVLLGPSGCGKSTLLRIIAGLDAPSEGRVEWQGGAPPRPGEIGFVFQDPTLLPWASAARNAALPLRLRGEADADAVARAALGRVGLAEAADRLPSQLSGGMRMRVSIARALASRPRLLLMDEPFAALDEFTRHRLQEDLRGLWAALGCTVVFVTHSLYEAAFLARRVVVMTPHPGRVAHELASPWPADTLPDRLSPAYAAQVAALTRAVAGP